VRKVGEEVTVENRGPRLGMLLQFGSMGRATKFKGTVERPRPILRVGQKRREIRERN